MVVTHISKMVTDYVGFIPCNRIICSSSCDFLGNNLQIVLLTHYNDIIGGLHSKGYRILSVCPGGVEQDHG